MVRQGDIQDLSTIISHCYLQELNKNYDECEYHGEYHIRLTNLDTKIVNLRNTLQNYSLKEINNTSHNLLSLIFILYKELQSIGSWNTENAVEYANAINSDSKKYFDIAIDDYLYRNTIYNNQIIFDTCIERLHRSLTPDKFKKYPSFIHVYCDIIENIHNYKVQINPMKTFPASVLLIEDHVPENKIKGLTCCRNIFKCLTLNDFQGGNYFDVIYAAVSKLLTDKNMDITTLALECAMEVIRILPLTSKRGKLDELFLVIIDEIFMETNFSRKKILFSFIKTIIHQHQTNCVKRKNKFMIIVCDNLDLCMNEGVRPMLLDSVIECLEIWLKYCSCVWKFALDNKLLSVLFKILYVVDLTDQETVNRLEQIITLLINLCNKEEKLKILSDMEIATSHIKCNSYLRKLDVIKDNIVDNKCK